jgi:radical SAM protein with 4Fe4S-binding SPASM domain
MFVRPVSDYGFALGRAEETVSVKDFVAFVRQLITEIVEINLKGQRLTEQFFMVHYRRFINAQGSTYVDLMAPAGYLKNTLLFDFNGNVFGSDEARMLHRKFGGNDFVLGNIRDERKNFNTSLSESLLNQTFLFDQPGCNTCVYQGSCGADPVYHVQSFGEPIGDKALSRFCQLHMAMFDLVAEMSLNPEFNAVFRSWLDV